MADWGASRIRPPKSRRIRLSCNASSITCWRVRSKNCVGNASSARGLDATDAGADLPATQPTWSAAPRLGKGARQGTASGGWQFTTAASRDGLAAQPTTTRATPSVAEKHNANLLFTKPHILALRFDSQHLFLLLRKRAAVRAGNLHGWWWSAQSMHPLWVPTSRPKLTLVTKSQGFVGERLTNLSRDVLHPRRPRPWQLPHHPRLNCLTKPRPIIAMRVVRFV